MTKEEILMWFKGRLNRLAGAADVYQVAKDFYKMGAYSRAMICLQYYSSLPDAEIHGHHLLGYCYLNLGEIENAFQEFKSCVNEGYNDDWQLVIELQMELEELRQKQAERGPTDVLSEDLTAEYLNVLTEREEQRNASI
ncbi:hypothetical protein BKA69DRAFT_1031680 [Paraphysoderma sedebokerense]|nr:hypothetical protein BKA69DRAFT_1031670 [Paraphysoderma sedebokerense]KAI9138210.1 hypothetical protein BKA69DRAFT_1031680 [Paraphysoderma sedebokerense]